MMSEVTCEACGSAFERTHGSQKFCKDASCRRRRTNERGRKWRKTASRDKLNEAQRNYRGRTDQGRRWELKSKYGITLEQWASMVSYVDSKCEICGKRVDNPCVDHDHVTGAVRGVLCRDCNKAIGQLGDTAESLQRAVDYLRKTQLGRNVPGDRSGVGIQEHLF